MNVCLCSTIPISPGSVSYSAHNYGFRNPTNTNCDNNAGIACLPARAVHERSHSDGTTTPMPVDLSMESSSVTSLSNLPLRKHTITSGKFEYIFIIFRHLAYEI